MVRILGTTLTVVGVLALVWGFTIWRWGDPVSALYTSWQQRQLATDYVHNQQEFLWTSPKIARAARLPEADPRVVKLAARRFRRQLHAGEAIGRIRVPELGLNMILVAGTDTASLRSGPGWDERTYLPGEGQLVYIAGHRTTFKAPFAHIDRLKAGQRIELKLPYGDFVYRVTRSVIVPATDLGRLVSRGSEEVVLQACHPRFSARERYLVYARPVRTACREEDARVEPRPGSGARPTAKMPR